MATAKLADIPLARPGFDALNMSVPVMMEMNPEGKWESCAPEDLDEKKLRTVIQHLVNSKTISAAQSYCCQCAKEGKPTNASSNYIPVIMMPIYPADQCPFDMNCEVEKMKATPAKKRTKPKELKSTAKSPDEKKHKKPGFVMQRLTDFDLLSQW